jgi:class 3 adenylate cyclase/tetratricopeptide (TPR) repeat protein
MRQPQPVQAATLPPQSPQSPSRRYLTLLFCDLSHSTRLGSLLEAEQYAALLDRLHHLGTTLIAQHGGTVARIQGDGMLAVFGHPQSGEDDARHAAEAALALHAAVRELDPGPGLPAELRPLTLHSGLHAGLVLVSEGDLMRGRLELAGNAPNIAARLAQEAGPDEILASEASLGPERGLFVTVARRQIVPRGTDQPLRVCRIVDRAQAQRRYEALRLRGLAAFVGREPERAGLKALLAPLASPGLGGLVVIGGGVGVGKTRLAEEFLRQAEERGCEVHQGWCTGDRVAEPWHPWLQMLRRLLGLRAGEAGPEVVDRAATELAALGEPVSSHASVLRQLLALAPASAPASAPPTAAAPGKPAVSALNHFQVLDAFEALFANLASSQPRALFVDDWQWADDASHRVLQRLHALALRAPILIVLTQRGGQQMRLTRDEPDAAPQLHLDLQPLDIAEAAVAIAQLLPTASPFERERIAASAGGNPLYIEELCHNLRDAGTLESEPERTLVPTPALPASAQAGVPLAWLDPLIASRVARLPPEQAALVRSAAVIGPVIADWLFERVTGVGMRDTRVQALADEDLLYPDVAQGQLVFKHGVARDAIYRAVGMAERSRLHQLAAGALHEAALAAGPQGEDHCEALAWHYAAAGLPAAAAQMAERAGDKALAASALDSAKAQYRAALAALDRLDPAPAVQQRWVLVAQRLGLACVFDADAADLPWFRRAVVLAESLGDARAQALTRYWLAYVAYGVGDTRAAVAESGKALALARDVGDDRLAVQLAATLGQALAAAAEYDAALPLLDAAIAVKRQHRSGTGLAVGLNYTLAVKATLLADRGDFEAADALFEEALAPVRGLNHQVEASILGLHAAALLWQGRHSEAQERGERCWRIGERVRSLFTCAMGRSASAFARWRLSGDADAAAAVAESTGWLIDRGVYLFGSLNQGWLCTMHAGSGDAAEARRAGVATLLAARRGDWLGLAMAGRALARLNAQTDPQRARFWLRQAQRAATRRGSAHEAAANATCGASLALRL